MIEIWRNIPEYNDYQVSNYGNVKSLKFGKELVLSQNINCNGYPYVILYKDKKANTVNIHRAVAKAFLYQSKTFDCVNHIDGIKSNNCVNNLEWCTNSQNHLHAIKNKLRVPKKGEESGRSKLSEQDIIKIRELRAKGFTQVQLANKFNISRWNIRAIINNESWKHLN